MIINRNYLMVINIVTTRDNFFVEGEKRNIVLQFQAFKSSEKF